VFSVDIFLGGDWLEAKCEGDKSSAESRSHAERIERGDAYNGRGVLVIGVDWHRGQSHQFSCGCVHSVRR